MAKKIKINPWSGFKNLNFTLLETLDEKYAVSEKTTKTWIIKIEHNIIY